MGASFRLHLGNSQLGLQSNICAVDLRITAAECQYTIESYSSPMVSFHIDTLAPFRALLSFFHSGTSHETLLFLRQSIPS